MSWLPNDRVCVERLAPRVTPSPVRETMRGLLLASLVMRSDAQRVPCTVGMKVIVAVQELAVAMDEHWPEFRLKSWISPSVRTRLTFEMDCLPVLEMERVLEVFCDTAVLGKARSVPTFMMEPWVEMPMSEMALLMLDPDAMTVRAPVSYSTAVG